MEENIDKNQEGSGSRIRLESIDQLRKTSLCNAASSSSYKKEDCLDKQKELGRISNLSRKHSQTQSLTTNHKRAQSFSGEYSRNLSFSGSHRDRAQSLTGNHIKAGTQSLTSKGLRAQSIISLPVIPSARIAPIATAKEKKFVNVISWPIFAVICLFSACLNIPPIIVIHNLNPQSFTLTSYELYEACVVYLDNERGTNRTLESFLPILQLFKKFAHSADTADTAWKICLTSGVIHISVLLLIFLYVYYFRHTHTVSRRGVYFFIHFWISAIFFLVCNLCYCAAILGQFSDSSSFSEAGINYGHSFTNAFHNVLDSTRIKVFVILVFLNLFMNGILSCFASRMHVVYSVFVDNSIDDPDFYKELRSMNNSSVSRMGRSNVYSAEPPVAKKSASAPIVSTSATIQSKRSSKWGTGALGVSPLPAVPSANAMTAEERWGSANLHKSLAFSAQPREERKRLRLLETQQQHTNFSLGIEREMKRTKKNRYFNPFPIYFLLFLCSVSVIALYTFNAYEIPSKIWVLFGMMGIPCIFFFIWISYYTYQCRQVSSKYLDYWANWRLVTLLLFVFLVSVIFNALVYSMAYHVFQLFVAQFYVTVCVLDMYAILPYIQYQKWKQDKREKLGLLEFEMQERNARDENNDNVVCLNHGDISESSIDYGKRLGYSKMAFPSQSTDLTVT